MMVSNAMLKAPILHRYLLKAQRTFPAELSPYFRSAKSSCNCLRLKPLGATAWPPFLLR